MQILIPLAVGFGGCVGALLRFYISGAVNRAAGESLVFAGTTAVNLIGCFLIGLLMIVAMRIPHLSLPVQKLLVTGLLGSLTTFSSFAMESLNLLSEGRVGTAATNAVVNVVVGVLLAWCGVLVAGTVFPETEQQSEIRISKSETDSNFKS